jgi:acetoin:2,6-dichlorophenolindophenol oxidoreductase subunit alpha
MAELYGKVTGFNKGKGGSMHIADLEIGMLGANGIVGAPIVIAGGAALSAQLRGTDQVTICFLGEGAINTGRFHEGINMAAVWNLPIVYIIENNLFAESTSIADSCKLTNLSERAAAYGIPGQTIDGNDVLVVYDAVAAAIAEAKKGHGPTLIEGKTYRYRGHFEGDQQTYASTDESKAWRKKDPIIRFRKHLIDVNVLTQKTADSIDREVEEEINRAVKFAEESAFPALEVALEDVFA